MPDDYFARPLKNKSIVELAYLWRDSLGVPANSVRVDIVRVVENTLPLLFPPFSLIIDADRNDDIEGCTEFDPPTIYIRESTYNAAVSGDGRARFTIAHELGHLMLHDSAIPMARAPIEYQRMKNLPAYASTEKQADKFAAAFLMPEWIVENYKDPLMLSIACGVSYKAASIELEKYLRRDRLYLPGRHERSPGR